MWWHDCDDSGSVNNDIKVFTHYYHGLAHTCTRTHRHIQLIFRASFIFMHWSRCKSRLLTSEVTVGNRTLLLQRYIYIKVPTKQTFTANANQSNASVICAHVAGTTFARVTGEKNSFLATWKLILPPWSFIPRMPANQTRVLPVHT